MSQTTMEEFVTKLFDIEREKKLLSEDRKDLIDSYKDKLDVKTVQAAIQIAKIRAKLDSSDEEINVAVNLVEKKICL